MPNLQEQIYTEHFINHVWADIVHYIPRKMANAPSKKNTNSNWMQAKDFLISMTRG